MAAAELRVGAQYDWPGLHLAYLGWLRKEVFLFGFMDSCVTFITVFDATRVRISARIDSLTRTSAI